MRTRHRFFRRWQNWLGLLLIAAFGLVAMAAPLLSPNDPNNPGPTKVVSEAYNLQPQPPSPNAPLGTLSYQISVYHALIWGARAALSFGLTVTISVCIIGVLVGTVSAYFGGFLNDLLMRTTDAFLSFPIIAGIVLFQQLITNLLYNAGMRIYKTGTGVGLSNFYTLVDMPQDLPAWLVLLRQVDPVMIAFILFSWMPYARIMHASVLRLKQAQYVQAAQVCGARHSRIIFKHLIPNAISPVIVLGARDVGGLVLLQATFTFIGLGGDSPWGMLLVRGRDWIINPGGILTYWWVFVPPALALILFGIGWNLLGDGLNDALNPREF